MNSRLVILSVASLSIVALGAVKPKEDSSLHAREAVRLVRHFDSVDVELKSRDVSMLSPAQRANRAKLTSWLRDYRNARVFPTNDRFSTPTPFFRDSKGVLCAMAYLVQRSGRSDIVNKVATTRNNAYIRELVDDPALVAWLDSSGLSAQEAGRIQPSYGGGFPPVDDTRDDVDDDVAVAAIALGGVSLASTAVNIVRPSYFSGFLGIIAGGAAIAVGANNLDVNRGTDHVAATTIGLGAVSVGAGIYGLLEARERDHDRGGWRDDRRDGRRRRFSMVVTPDLSMQASQPKLGLLVHGRF